MINLNEIYEIYLSQYGDPKWWPAKNPYEMIKKYFEMNISKNAQVYNNFHAFIVINGKNHCKKIPFCSGCPLENICGYSIFIP